jgi:hypothetical protein
VVSQGVLRDFKPGKQVGAKGLYYSQNASMAGNPGVGDWFTS